MQNRDRRGNVILEFCVGAGLLLALFSGVYQFGYTFYQFNVLRNAVNAGAQYASLRPYDSNSAQPSEAFRSAIRNVVLYGDPAGGETPVAPGLAPANVTVVPIFANGVPVAMQVSIVNYSINYVFGSSMLLDKPTATYPYAGIYSPY